MRTYKYPRRLFRLIWVAAGLAACANSAHIFYCFFTKVLPRAAWNAPTAAGGATVPNRTIWWVATWDSGLILPLVFTVVYYYVIARLIIRLFSGMYRISEDHIEKVGKRRTRSVRLSDATRVAYRNRIFQYLRVTDGANSLRLPLWLEGLGHGRDFVADVRQAVISAGGAFSDDEFLAAERCRAAKLWEARHLGKMASVFVAASIAFLWFGFAASPLRLQRTGWLFGVLLFMFLLAGLSAAALMPQVSNFLFRRYGAAGWREPGPVTAVLAVAAAAAVPFAAGALCMLYIYS